MLVQHKNNSERDTAADWIIDVNHVLHASILSSLDHSRHTLLLYALPGTEAGMYRPHQAIQVLLRECSVSAEADTASAEAVWEQRQRNGNVVALCSPSCALNLAALRIVGRCSPGNGSPRSYPVGYEVITGLSEEHIASMSMSIVSLGRTTHSVITWQ